MQEVDTGMHPKTGQLFMMSYVPRNGSKLDERTHKFKTMLRPKSYIVSGLSGTLDVALGD